MVGMILEIEGNPEMKEYIKRNIVEALRKIGSEECGRIALADNLGILG